MSTKSTLPSLDNIQKQYFSSLKKYPNSINHIFKFCLYHNYDFKYWEIQQWWNDKSKRDDEDKKDEDTKPENISNEVERFVFLDKDEPLNKFTVNDICYLITKWVHNDITYKDEISKTIRIFAEHKLYGDKIMILSVEDIKRIVKEEMIDFTSENTLNIMFKGFRQWIEKEKKENNENIKSKNHQFIANILFHYPLNELINRIKKDAIDGKKFIEIDQQFIAQETGWRDEQVEQIQLILMRYSVVSNEEFKVNVNNIFNDEIKNDSKSTDQISNDVVSEIKAIIQEFDAETLQYNYKNNKLTKNVEQFNDKIYNFVNKLFSETDENDDIVNQIYTKVAKCFTFNYNIEKDDSNDFRREWVCSNCGNFNFCKYIAGKLNNILTNCTLCGITQDESVLLQIRNYDRYTMVNTNKDTSSTENDIKEHKQDEVDDMINKVINAKNISMQCPNRTDQQHCPSMIRLAKQLIEYNRVLKRLPEYDIKSTVEVDIVGYINKKTFTSAFINNVKSCDKLNENEQNSIIKLVEDNVDHFSDVKTFLSKNRKTFIQMIRKRIPSIKAAKIKNLHSNISTSLKQVAHSKQFDSFLTNLNMDVIEKDYQHILTTHINVSEKDYQHLLKTPTNVSEKNTFFRKHAFKFFNEVVHYEDVKSIIEKLECRSVERTSDRTKQMLSQTNSKSKTQTNANTSDDKHLWKKRQQYNQCQLDVIHSYLVHYNSNKSNQQNNDANKGKYISGGAEYGFGVSHEHHHLEPIFNSIYQEMMDNKRCKLTDANFEDELTKAIQKVKVAIRDHKELICKYYSKQYKIIRNDPIAIRHILSIVIYTDMSHFCTAYRQSYRQMQENETDEQVAQRHKELYNYSRALYEAAEFFGTYMDDKMEVYHGLNAQMNFKEFHAYFNQPISTTSSIQAAQMFSRGTGIILTLRSAAKHLNDASKTPKYLSVSWTSDFPGEEERLFYGAYVIFEISNIMEAHTLQQHSKELSAFNRFQKLIQNIPIESNDKNNSDIQILRTLINQRRKIHEEQKSDVVSEYGTTLFNYFCDNVSWVSIQRFIDLPQNLKNAMFYSNNDVSILSLVQIFPNLQEIALTELNIEEMEINTISYTEAVYKCISHSNKTHQKHLKKISFKSKRRNDTKERTTLKRLQEANHEKFKKCEWTVKYQCKMENTHDVIFTNDAIETADKIKNLQENIKELEKQKTAIEKDQQKRFEMLEKKLLNQEEESETEDEYEQDSFIVDASDKNEKLSKLAQIEQQKRKIKKEAEIKDNSKQHQLDAQVVQTGGLFRIKVHIIACRGLKTSAKDIVTRVRIFDETQSTIPISKANNSYWAMNHMLYFKSNLAHNELSHGKCLITVYNERCVLRDIKIGSYEFDLSMIYYKKHHEIFNQWVALVNTDKLLQSDDDSESEMDETNKGIGGYMLVSIIILGPNDEQFVHTEAELPSLESAMILKPRGIVQKPYLLTVKVHKLRNLARAHEFSITKKAKVTSNLDPIVYVEYAGLILRAKKVWNGFSPVISTKFLLPVMEPVFDKDIIITIMNYGFLERNDRIGCVRVEYHLLKSRANLVENEGIKVYHVKPRWYHMYGAPIGYSRGYARKMNKGLVEGSNYRGSVLLEFEVKKCDTKPVADTLPIKHPKQRTISALISVTSDNEPFIDTDNVFDNYEQKKEKTAKYEPGELEYYIRAEIYEGTVLNDIRGVSFSEICIGVEVANCRAQSSWKTIREKHAYIQWYESLENVDMYDEKLRISNVKEDKNKLIGPFKIPANWEEDAIEMPDVFIYIFVKAISIRDTTEPISYCRVPLSEILPKKHANMWSKPATWYDMKQNLALDRYGMDVFHGSLLIGLNSGTKTHESHKQLQIHNFQKQIQPFQNDSKYDESEIDESDIENIVIPKSNNANIMILIHEAVNLPKLDRDGLCDPFVKLTISANEPTTISKSKLGKESGMKKTKQRSLKDIEYRTDRTKVKKGTLNPNWGGEVFKFLNVDLTKEKFLDLEVWDWDWPAENEFGGFVEGGIRLDMVLESKEENVDIENKWFTLKVSEYAMKKYKKNKNKKNKKPVERSIQISIYYDFLDEQEVNEINKKYSKKKKKKVTETIKEIFVTSNLFSKKNDAMRQLSKLEKDSQRKAMTLIIHLFKATNLRLADAFVKIRFCGIEKQSAIVNKHIDPQWNEILTLQARVPHFQNLNNAPRIYCEVLEHEKFNNISIGRITVNPGKVRHDMEKNDHNMKQYEKSYAEKYASWKAVENSQHQRVEGELLISFQLIEGFIEDWIEPIPATVLRNKVKYNLQIITTGLRDIKSICGVHKTFLQFEINGITYETNESNMPDERNPSFYQIVAFSIMLPENSNFWPNLNIKIIDSICGGSVKRTIGYSSVDISEYANNLQEDEIKDDEKDYETHYHKENKDDVVIGIDNNVSNRIKRKTIIKNNNGYHEIAQDSDDGSDVVAEYDSCDYEVFHCSMQYQLGNSAAKYMDNRKTFQTELEHHLNLEPFHEELCFSGKDKKTPVAKFKGHISLTKYDDNYKGTDKYRNKYFKDMRKQELFLRLYVLHAQNLKPKDNVDMEWDVTNIGNAATLSPDPYLKIKFADTEISTRDRYISNTFNPEFYDSFVFLATLPGPSKLCIEVWDYDGIDDDLFGQTIIDIEDRWYSAEWREYEKRTGEKIPVEVRTLSVNETNKKFGKLFLFLELVPPEVHKRLPMAKIRSDPETDHELRLIIWECKGIENPDVPTNRNDLYITGSLMCTTEEDEPHLQETDTHLASYNGNGSFNWRMKFPIKLPKQKPSDCPRLKLQIWDADYVSEKDCISEAVIPLAGFLRYYDIHCQNNIPLKMVNDKTMSYDDFTKFWIHMDAEQKSWNSMKDTVASLFNDRGRGKILISLEILPIKNAKRLSNGFGRDKPNRYPKLPEPTEGREKCSLSYVRKRLGDYRCGQLACTCIWIGVFAFFLFITPNLVSATFANIVVQ